jgi:hypothetical protein
MPPCAGADAELDYNDLSSSPTPLLKRSAGLADQALPAKHLRSNYKLLQYADPLPAYR